MTVVALQRLALFAGGFGVAVFACTSPGLRDSLGFLDGPAATWLSVAAAMWLAGAGAGRSWAASARWSALAILGAAAHLSLIEAGPTVSYHHLRVTASVAWLVLAVQAVLVGAGLWRAHVRPLGEIRSIGPVWLLVCAALVLWFFAAVPSAAPVEFAIEITVMFGLQILHLATAWMAVLSLPDDLAARVDGWMSAEGPTFAGVDRWGWVGAAFVTVLAAVLCLVVYQNHPHIPDELAYVIPAKYFAEGLLFQPAPPVAEAFDVDLITNDGTRFYTPIPPGWPAVLAIGTALGVPWLVNPVLGGLCVLLTTRLLGSLYDTRTARLGTLIAATSPWLIFLSMSFMTHVLTLAIALIAAISVDEARRRGVTWPTLIGGAALGWSAVTRPLDALAIAGAVGLWALVIKGKPFRFAPLVVLASTSAVVAAVTLPYNRFFTGSATSFPLMAYTDAKYGAGTNDLGFGPDRGWGWTGLDPIHGHGPIDVVINAVLNTSAINMELFGWATGSLVALALLVCAKRLNRVDVGMLIAAGIVAGLHSLYWFSGGPDFGARYWFLTILPLIAVSARGLAVLGDLARERAGAGRGAFAALMLCLVSAVTFLPWRALDKYHDYRGMNNSILTLAETEGFGSDLVFVSGMRHPDYASTVIYNPVDWRADETIYAWDRSDEVTGRVLDEYPDRRVWFVDGPTLTGAGFSVTAGPLSPAEARARVGQ